MGSAAAVVLGSWFMMREVELATTRARLVKVDGVGAQMFVEWSLPASKNDSEAVGVSRRHGCCCGVSLSFRCPAHAAQRQLARLAKLFPNRFQDGLPDEDLPMFPTVDGAVVAKEEMVETIIQAAKLLKVDVVSLDGSERISGHSLRVTGAQGLARSGVECWAIQLLGRWGSDAVLGYIRAVPLERSTEWARKVGMDEPLEKIVEEAVRKSVGSFLAKQAMVSSSSSASVPPTPSVGSLAVSLTEALEHEVGVAMPGDPDEPKFVKSLIGVYHKIPKHGSVGSIASWVTTCGWRFAASGGGAEVKDRCPEPLHYKFMCGKCFKVERAAAKAKL